MTRYAVLLRGINVGRARPVGMADLRVSLEKAGYQAVATLLRSGNVVLDAEQPAESVIAGVQQVINERFGFPVDALARTREQVLDLVARDPLGQAAADGSKYVVAFLARPLDPPAVAALSAIETGEDRLLVDGSELYVWCPNGLMDSPMMTALGAVKGGPIATVRNWNTVRKLAALLDRDG